jgi:hypothetical protein
MAGIEQEIKELVGRTDQQPLGVYSTVETLAPEDTGDGDAATADLSAGTIHLVDASADTDGTDLNLPDPTGPSKLITVKVNTTSTGDVNLVTPSDVDVEGGSNYKVPDGEGSVVEVVSDGDNYHVISEIDNSGT